MQYSPKHATPRSTSRLRARALGVAIASGATVTAGLGFASSAQAAAPSDVWDRVAACESGGNWNTSTGNGFSGGLQFTPSTWRAHGGTGSAASASKAQQVAVAKRVLKTQGPGAWPVCSRKAGLTKSNGGAASASAAARASRSQVRHAVKVKRSNGSYKGAAKVVRTKPVVKRSVNRVHHKAVHKAARPVNLNYFGMSRHAVRDTQSWLGLKRTGQWNRQMTRKLQHRVGAYADGTIGKQTVYRTEKYVGIRPTGLSHLSRPTMMKLMAHGAAH